MQNKQNLRKFDTKVQKLKYKVLREVARHAWDDTLFDELLNIPKKIIPGPEPTTRCCIYKERAIVEERIKMAMGGDKNNPNVIEVIELACDECPVAGYSVTDVCRGCLAHRCEDVCRRNAVYFDRDSKAHIDKDKCVECGQCAKACPYGAILNFKRPCERACKVNAVSMGENKAAKITNEKCVSCGACVYQCPFGAIVDKSFILNVIDILKKSENNTKYKTIAVVAPAISSQFSYAKLGQVISGIKALGFHTVVEAALGADLVSLEETEELVERGFLTSSCCPAFVSLIEKHYPQLVEHISHNPSPMARIGKYIKEVTPGAKVVFIGPCTAKKGEARREKVKPFVDEVMTFEELQALFDSKDLEISAMPEDVLDNASYYGRIFARSGGLSDAIVQAVKELNINEFEFKNTIADGLDECKMALLKKSKNIPVGNFIEGMACTGGCINGAGCLTHGEKNKAEVDKYGHEAYEKTIMDAVGFIKK